MTASNSTTRTSPGRPRRTRSGGEKPEQEAALAALTAEFSRRAEALLASKPAGSIRFREGKGFEGRVLLRNARKRISVSGKNHEEVQRKLDEAVRRDAEGFAPANQTETVAAYLAGWLDTKRAELRPATFVTYRDAVVHHIVPALGTIPLYRLTPSQVQGALTRWQQGGRQPVRGQAARDRARPLEAQTVKNIHSVLRSALTDAVRFELIERNPAAAVRPPRVDRQPVRAVTVDDGRAILAAVAGHRHEVLYTLALASGARLSELLGATWSECDLDRRTLRVTRTLRRVEGQWVWGLPKSTSSIRILHLEPFIAEMLRAHRVRTLADRLRAGTLWSGEWDDLIFVNEVGLPVGRTGVTRELEALLARAGLPRMTFHALRHAAASIAFAEGAPMRAVSEWLGHSDIGVTSRVYVHLSDEQRRDAPERVGSALRPDGR